MIHSLHILILLARCCNALIGYDCDSPHNNGTTISLLESGDCNSNGEDPILRNINIELLHHPRFFDVNVLSCRIEIDNIINKLETTNAKEKIKNKRYYLPVTQTACMYLHTHGELQLGNFSFRDLSADNVNSRSIPLTELGDTQTPPSRDLKSKLKVNSFVHIVFKQSLVKVDALANKILLPIGSSCIYTHLQCSDEEGYQNFWSPVFHTGCERLPQAVKYRGIAKWIHSDAYPDAYALSYNDMQVLLFIRTQHDACDVTVLQTEHPRLVIQEISDDYLKNKKIINKLRLLTLYDTNNYVHTISNDAQSLKNFYISTSIDKCKKKEIELRTSMLIADRDPSLFAYALTGTPGYTARIRGEAAQLYRCTPVPARLRITGDCYQELPVTINDEPMYLQPKTRIITRKGTEIACDPLTTAIYKLQNQWNVLTPEAKILASSPETLRPGSLPWGRDYDTRSIDRITDSPKEDTATKHSIGTNESTYTAALTITATACVLIILIILARKLTGHSPSTGRSNWAHRPPHDIHRSPGSSSEHRDDRGEVPRRTCQHTADLNDELHNLRDAYRNLEMRISHCMPPELDKLAVASSHRCSQSNEGGVTYGASA
jgi:hypothetical protein